MKTPKNPFDLNSFCRMFIALLHTLITLLGVMGITIDSVYKIDSFNSSLGLSGAEERIQLKDVYSCSSAVISNKCDTSKPTAGVTRAHKPGKSNDDVKLMRFKNRQNISIFPNDVHDFFPNLEAVDFPDLPLEFLLRTYGLEDDAKELFDAIGQQDEIETSEFCELTYFGLGNSETIMNRETNKLDDSIVIKVSES